MNKYFTFFFIIFMLMILAKPVENDIPGVSDTIEITESINFFAMDTLISLNATGENSLIAINESKEFIQNFEKIISPTLQTSDLYLLNNNNGEPYKVSDTMYKLTEISLNYAKSTNGLFDPSIASIINLWGIGTDSAKIPAQDDIDTCLKSVSFDNIILLEDNFIQLNNNAIIDFGAIAKGYAADKIYEIYRKYDIKSGIISLAGNVYLVGTKEDNTEWTVGITDPDLPSKQNISIKVNDISVVTAGAYERFFEEDGEIWHHIFDTKTGYPTNKDIKSVTIISKNSTLADVYSTTLFAMGFSEAIEFLESNNEIDALIIDKNNNVYITENIKNSVILTSKYLTI